MPTCRPVIGDRLWAVPVLCHGDRTATNGIVGTGARGSHAAFVVAGRYEDCWLYMAVAQMVKRFLLVKE
jgi:hypothetical protein